jgi:hypothetical protein
MVNNFASPALRAVRRLTLGATGSTVTPGREDESVSLDVGTSTPRLSLPTRRLDSKRMLQMPMLNVSEVVCQNGTLGDQEEPRNGWPLPERRDQRGLTPAATGGVGVGPVNQPVGPKSTRKRRFCRIRGEGRRSGQDFGLMFMRVNARLRARTPPTESQRILYNAPPSAPWGGVPGLAWPSLTAGKGKDATGLGRQIKHLPNLLHPGDCFFTGAEP